MNNVCYNPFIEATLGLASNGYKRWIATCRERSVYYKRESDIFFLTSHVISQAPTVAFLLLDLSLSWACYSLQTLRPSLFNRMDLSP